MIKKLKSAYFSLYVQPPVFQYTVHGDQSGYDLVTNAIVAIPLPWSILYFRLKSLAKIQWHIRFMVIMVFSHAVFVHLDGAEKSSRDWERDEPDSGLSQKPHNRK